MLPARQKDIEVVIVQEPDSSTRSGQELIRLIAQLEMPELCFEER
jgi:hypothetical protein